MAILQLPTRKDLFGYEQSIEIENTTYFFVFKFNRRMDRWQIDIQDQNKVDLVSGVPLLTNVDITKQVRYLAIPKGYFLVFDTEGDAINPSQKDLGDRVQFLYQEDAA